MSELITSQGLLFVGGLDEAFDENLVTKIDCFINVADEINISYRVGAGYFKAGIADDDEMEDITRILEPTLNFINSQHQAGKTVMVHCLEGKSRSVGVCIAYLVKFDHESVESAFDKIKKIRPEIDIFPLYFNQIKQWSSML